MAISYINGVAAAAATATIPAHAIGDLIVAFAFRDGNTTAPSLGSGFTNINTASGTSCSARIAYRFATVTNTAAGTWTNATGVIFLIYRGVDSALTPNGALTSGVVGSGTVNYPALNSGSANGWIAGLIGHRSTDMSGINGAPGAFSGAANRVSETVNATNDLASWDTNGTESGNIAASTRAVSGTSSGYVSAVVGFRPAATPQTIAITQATETDTGQAVTKVGGSSEERLFIGVTPSTTNFNEGNALSTGTMFVPAVDGTIRGITTWIGSDTTPTTGYAIALYGPGTGTLIGSRTGLTLSVPSAPGGWVRWDFTTPLQVTAGQYYYAVVFRPLNSRYGFTNNYFDADRVVGNLKAPDGTEADGAWTGTVKNGGWVYGASIAVPTATAANENYFVDPIFLRKQTVAIGQATETDTANAFTPLGTLTPALVKSAGGTSQAASVTASLGSASAAGNLLVLHIVSDGAAGAIQSGPSGWTLSNEMSQLGLTDARLYWKISTGDTTAGYTIAGTANSAWTIAEFSGVDPDGVDVPPQGKRDETSNTTITTDTLTPTRGRRLLICGVGAANTSSQGSGISAFSNSFTEIVDAGNTLGAPTGTLRCANGIAYRVVSADGATAYTSAGTFGYGSIGARHAFMIPFRAALAPHGTRAGLATETDTANAITFTGPVTEERLFVGQVPATQENNEGTTLSLGTMFTPAVNGKIKGIWVWIGSSSAPTTGYAIALYGPAAATLIASRTGLSITVPNPSNWVRLDFVTPLDVTAGQYYMAVAYYPLNARYAATDGYFASTARTVGNLTAPSGSYAGWTPSTVRNGAYVYSTGIACPNTHFNNASYFIDPIFAATAAGQTISAGQASETDTATAAGRAKSKAVAQSTETDTGTASTRAKARAIGQATSTETATAITRAKKRYPAQVTETDTATAATRSKVRAVAQGTETDTGTAITRLKRRYPGQATETDSSIAVVLPKRRLAALTSETDTATAVTRSKVRALAQSTEVDTATAISRVKVRSAAQATETDSATAAMRVRSRTAAQSSETDTATALARSKARALAQATETDSSIAVVVPKRRLGVQTVETDSAFAVARTKVRALAQSSETDTGTAISRAKSRATAQSSETDAATATARAKVRSLAQSSEADSATALTRAKRRYPGQAVETDSATGATSVRSRTASQAVETDTGTALTRAKRRAVAQSVETDSSIAVVIPRRRLAATSTETDAAFGFARAKSRPLAQAAEADSSSVASRAKARGLIAAAEADTSQALTFLRTRIVAAAIATEADTATAIARSKVRSAGQASAAETAGAFSASQDFRETFVDLPLVSETDTATALTHSRARATLPAIETDSGTAAARAKRLAVGQAAETDAGQTLGRVKRTALAFATETDSSIAVAARQAELIGQPVETDTATPLGRRRSFGTGQAAETDAATAISRAKQLGVVQAAEADSSITFAIMRAGVTGAAFESDEAIGVARQKRFAVALASETDAAQPLFPAKGRTVAASSESDTAQSLGRIKLRALGPGIEADVSQSVQIAVYGQAGVAFEDDFANALTRAKRRSIASASEQDSAALVLLPDAIVVEPVQESDAAQPLAFRRTYRIAVASQTDSAQPLARAKRKATAIALSSETATAVRRIKLHVGGLAITSDIALPAAHRRAFTIPIAAEVSTALPLERFKVRPLPVAAEWSYALPFTYFHGVMGVLVPEHEDRGVTNGSYSSTGRFGLTVRDRGVWSSNREKGLWVRPKRDRATWEQP